MVRRRPIPLYNSYDVVDQYEVVHAGLNRKSYQIIHQAIIAGIKTRSYFITSFPFHNRYCVSLKSYVFSVTEGRIIYEKAGICNRQGTDG